MYMFKRKCFLTVIGMWIKAMMQRAISISGRENPTVSAASPPFAGDYDIATSLYPSILPPNHSPLLDYLTDGSSISPSMESERALAPYWPQFQQQRLHQDLVDRHHRVISHLREVAKQAQALRQENVNLKMTNLDLNNRLNLLLNATPFHGVDLGLVLDALPKMGIGAAEEGTIENEAVAKSPTSVMDSGREEWSGGYLKAVRAGGSSGKGGDCVGASNRNKIDNGTQKVYVKGSKKEEPLELEVYNQGMFKTELCNKWQQTGTCPYGDNCQFAHGIDELRPVLRHPRYKTEVCRMVLNAILVLMATVAIFAIL
ncbi:hypothetical protein DH2020_034194 [Rehmannia glutinosa]|uniref:C3H1-type domain-containing protein n=1 Tax=Rehmannia glutinosa TaxID=99300 RepID=A0ABR0VAP5_REHGL